MSVPDPVGRIHFDQPRAVQIREPENIKSVHSAIHCGVNIFTDSRRETEHLLRMWPYIMADLSNSIEGHIRTMTSSAEIIEE